MYIIVEDLNNLYKKVYQYSDHLTDEETIIAYETLTKNIIYIDISELYTKYINSTESFISEEYNIYGNIYKNNNNNIKNKLLITISKKLQLKEKKVSLTISGGGLRSIAALGVIDFLKENNIEISELSGSSGGAIIGLLYSYGMEKNEIIKFINSLNKLLIFKPTFTSLFSLSHLEKMLNIILKNKKQTIPFSVCVTNLKTGEFEYIQTLNLNRGNTIKYVIASSSLLPFFKPVNINEELYADGGYTDNMPVAAIKDNLTKISCNVNVLNGNNIIRKVAFILMNSNIRYSKSISDIHLDIDLKNMGLFDFNKINFAIKTGYDTIKNNLTISLKN